MPAPAETSASSAAAAAAPASGPDVGRWNRRAERGHGDEAGPRSNLGPEESAVPQPSRFQPADQRSMYSEQEPRW